MLKSATTALGIIFGILALVDIAVSPSEARQLGHRLPAEPIVKDWTRCRRGKLLNCTQVASLRSSSRYVKAAECIRRDRCTPSGKLC